MKYATHTGKNSTYPPSLPSPYEKQQSNWLLTWTCLVAKIAIHEFSHAIQCQKDLHISSPTSIKTAGLDIASNMALATKTSMAVAKVTRLFFSLWFLLGKMSYVYSIIWYLVVNIHDMAFVGFCLLVIYSRYGQWESALKVFSECLQVTKHVQKKISGSHKRLQPKRVTPSFPQWEYIRCFLQWF